MIIIDLILVCLYWKRGKSARDGVYWGKRQSPKSTQRSSWALRSWEKKEGGANNMWCGSPCPSPPLLPLLFPRIPAFSPSEGSCRPMWVWKNLSERPQWFDWGPCILNLENTVPQCSHWSGIPRGEGAAHNSLTILSLNILPAMLKDSWYIVNWLISFKPPFFHKLRKTNDRPIIGVQDLPPPKAIGMNLNYRQTEKNNFCPLFPFDILFWHFNYMFPHLTFASVCL